MSAPNPNIKLPVFDFYLSQSEISSSDDEGTKSTKNLESSPQKSEAIKSSAFHVDDKNAIVVLQEHG